jgi:hypothetical protein
MIVNLINYLKERQRTVKLLGGIATAIMVIWTMVGVDTHHAHTWMEAHIPGFWSFFAILSCLVLIYFSRWFGKSGIMTKEDYYGD